MRHRFLSFAPLLAALAAAAAGAAPTAPAQPPDVAAILAEAVPFASAQLKAISKAGFPAGQYPNGTDWTHRTGVWQTTGPDRWTAGYLCGCYWKMYALTGSRSWAKLATAQLGGLEVYSNDNGGLSHDFTQSFVEALAAAMPGAPLGHYKRVIKKVAAVWESRYSTKVGGIRTWGKADDNREFKIIIDSMASLFLMPLAARLPGGKRKWRDMALSHARLAARNHFRSDGSTYHLVVYNPRTGRLRSQGTHQGYSDDSTWSRGQAWAVVGFTEMYRSTRDPAMLATAKIAADYFLARLAEADDGVPLWDFDVPASAKQPWKDSSAASIAASGLLRLGPLAGSDKYTQAGVEIMQSLVQKGGYLARDASGPRLQSILRNGTWTAPGGNYATGLIYGDYYFLDALVQLKAVQQA